MIETLNVINLVADSDALKELSLEKRTMRLNGDAFFLGYGYNADHHPYKSASHLWVAFILFKLGKNLLDKVLDNRIGVKASLRLKAKVAVDEESN